MGFFDPQKGDHDTFSMKGDGLAARRLELKSKAKGTRCGVRYQRMRVGKTPAKRKKAAR